VAGVEPVDRLIHLSASTNLATLALAGAIGYAGNFIAARIADGRHARADLVADRPAAHFGTGRDHDSGGLDAQRHWRAATNIPPSGAYDLVAVADTGGPDLHENLALPCRARVCDVEDLDGRTSSLDPRYAHRPER
jgi:hypothetical protein